MNDTPSLSQVPASPVPSGPAASPGPSQTSPGSIDGAPPSTAESGNWYGKTDVDRGDTTGTFNPGDGTGKPPPGEQRAEPQPDPGLHGEPPSALQQALPPREYQAFKLPEGMQGNLDPKSVREFTQIFDAGRGNDHQTSAQRLIDMHMSEIKKVGEQAAQYQREVWNRYNETQINELKADPELGGQRLTETLGNAKYALETHSGLTREEISRMLAKWDNGGVSNDRLTIKFLNNLYRKFAPPQPVDGQTPTASKIMSTGGDRDWYGAVDGPNRGGPR